jgi:phosphoglycolate phosphatase-like HAD superfamily hydrolase
MKILLFDIDGTILNTSGAGKAAMEHALRSTFQIEKIIDTVPYSGRTDQAIGRDLLRVHGLPETDEFRLKLTNAYLDALPHELSKKSGVVCPGLLTILEAAGKQPDIHLGLLTGNVERGARIKLGHFDLWNTFSFGGYGDEHFHRDDVARTALANAERHVGQKVSPDQVWVIGDTPLDVQCARAIGAKAVAVATGWHSIGELQQSNPDYLYTDLTLPTELLKAWGLLF